MDAGRRADAAPAPRPDAGPRYPDAEDEIVLAVGDTRTVRLDLDARLAVLDVHFSIDTTESFAQEIDELQRNLDETIIAGIAARVPMVAFGISRFEDFPGGQFGTPGDHRTRPDRPFELLTAITSDSTRIASAVAALDQPLGLGGDGRESGAEALWQIATGEGYRLDGEDIIAPYRATAPAKGGGLFGGVGLRENALGVVVHITDAPSHEPRDYGTEFPKTHSLEEAAEALAALELKLIGVVSKNCNGVACEPVGYGETRGQLEMLAFATETFAQPDEDGTCPHGVEGASVPAFEEVCPLVFDVQGDGSGLSETLVDAIVDLVDGIRFERVHAEASDDPLGFVRDIVAVEVEQDDGVSPPTIEDRLPEDGPDGSPDTFVDVRAKARLGFDVRFRNAHITPTDVDQRFRVRVRIVGDGLIVAEHTLRVVVPAATSDRDAGALDDAG